MGAANPYVLMLVLCCGGDTAEPPTHVDEGPLPPQVGDLAPECTALDDAGRNWALAAQRMQSKYVVVFFYPGDFKFCATRQVQKYRDAMPDLAARDITVVGVSGNRVAAHRRFKQVHGLNFRLLSDFDGSLATTFGVPLRRGGRTPAYDALGKPLLGANGKTLTVRRGVTPRRWTFIIGPEGRVLYRATQVSATGDVPAVLEFIDALEAGSQVSTGR